MLKGRPQASPPMNYVSRHGVFNLIIDGDMRNQVFDLNNVTTSTSGKVSFYFVLFCTT